MNDSLSQFYSPRRSRPEIICDIMQVISEGGGRPTQIMYRANVTWNDLMTYLETLARHEFIRREDSGSRVTYGLTQKGKDVLELYLGLKIEISKLGLETINLERLSKALASRADSGTDSTLSVLTKILSSSGFKILGNKVVGKSGQEFTFSVVAEASDGSKHGFVVLRNLTEREVLTLFVEQLDTEIYVHALFEKATARARGLAKVYSIKLISWNDAGKKTLSSLQN